MGVGGTLSAPCWGAVPQSVESPHFSEEPNQDPRGRQWRCAQQPLNEAGTLASNARTLAQLSVGNDSTLLRGPLKHAGESFWLSQRQENPKASGGPDETHLLPHPWSPRVSLHPLILCLRSCPARNCGTNLRPNPLGQRAAGPNFRSLRAADALLSLLSCWELSPPRS